MHDVLVRGTSQAAPIANTTTGRVQGFVDRGVCAFMGIPFAAPPIGPRRFRAPEPPAPWSGVRPCLTAGPACPQFADLASKRYRAAEGRSEDCLSLNVWTPALDDARRPAVIFFHGGGYQSGSGAVPIYNGVSFAHKDTVLITANYRLALFGYLYLDPFFGGFEGSGNAGLLDQMRALEWIRDNITAFGGDPDRVTIFGSSAGAGSVVSLMAAPRARGLFRRAMPVSGGGAGRSVESATRVTQRFLDYVGVQAGDTAALLGLSAEQLTLAPGRSSIPDRVESTARPSSRLWDELRDAAQGEGSIGPVIDDVVLFESPIAAISAGKAADIDLLTGSTTDEARGSFWKLTASAPDPDLAAAAARNDPAETHDIAPLFKRSDRALADIRAIYDASLLANGRETTDKDVFAAASSDRMIQRTIQFATAHSAHNAHTYLYRFAWRLPANGGLLGAFHGMGTPFVFDNLHEDPSWEVVLGKDPPQGLATQVQQALVSFAATGDPNHAGMPHWPNYNAETRPTMTFDVESHVDQDPEPARRELWAGLIAG